MKIGPSANLTDAHPFMRKIQNSVKRLNVCSSSLNLKGIKPPSMTVQLHVHKEILREYLSFIFPKLPSGDYKVSKTHDFGRALCSFARYSNIRVPGDHGQDIERVTFRLPRVAALNNALGYHLYYTRDDEEKLNDYLSLIFDLDFDRYYLAGKASGEQKKDIIMSFIASRKLSRLLSDPELLKKRQYRTELKLLEARMVTLSKRAYARNDRITYYKRVLYAS